MVCSSQTSDPLRSPRCPPPATEGSSNELLSNPTSSCIVRNAALAKFAGNGQNPTELVFEQTKMAIDSTARVLDGDSRSGRGVQRDRRARFHSGERNGALQLAPEDLRQATLPPKSVPSTLVHYFLFFSLVRRNTCFLDE